MLKKDLTVWEHLKTIQSDGGKARWAKLTPEERSAHPHSAGLAICDYGRVLVNDAVEVSGVVATIRTETLDSQSLLRPNDHVQRTSYPRPGLCPFAAEEGLLPGLTHQFHRPVDGYAIVTYTV
jgi:hypothetical protein